MNEKNVRQKAPGRVIQANCNTKKPELPHFLVIGAARCGTSSLHENLRVHPKLCPGRLDAADRFPHDPLFEKEIHFFDREKKFSRGLQWYSERWSMAIKGQLRFETTPNYLFHPKCPARIAEVIPNGRFIIMLRNPVDRAWSHFWFWKDKNQLNVYDLQNRNLDIIRKGIYYDQMKRWLCQFALDRFLIIRSEDFFKDPGKIILQVYEWLGIDPVISNHQIYFDPRRPGAKKRTRIPDPPDHIRKYLKRFYAKYNLMLFDLLERDFEWGDKWS